ncbi:hypothetical protein SLA2020_451670 [Shorea laevis]
MWSTPPPSRDTVWLLSSGCCLPRQNTLHRCFFSCCIPVGPEITHVDPAAQLFSSLVLGKWGLRGPTGPTSRPKRTDPNCKGLHFTI